MPSPVPITAKDPVSPEEELPELPPPVLPTDAGADVAPPIVVVVEANDVVVVEGLVVDVDVVVVDEVAGVDPLATPAKLTLWAPLGPVTVKVAVVLPAPVGAYRTESSHDAPAARLHDEGVTENALLPPVTDACTFIASPDAQSSTDDVLVAPEAAAELMLDG